MNPVFRSPIIVCARKRSFGVVLALLLLAANLTGASAQGVPAPELQRVITMPTPSSLIIVRGEGFTPGGLVQVVIQDRSGEETYASTWTVASVEVLGPHGSQDPAYVPARPGTIFQAMPINQEAVYGLNGSQDPAQGYVAGTSSLVSSHGDLIVQALDVRAGAWSNQLAISSNIFVAADDLRIFGPAPMLERERAHHRP